MIFMKRMLWAYFAGPPASNTPELHHSSSLISCPRRFSSVFLCAIPTIGLDGRTWGDTRVIIVLVADARLVFRLICSSLRVLYVAELSPHSVLCLLAYSQKVRFGLFLVEKFMPNLPPFVLGVADDASLVLETLETHRNQ